MSFDSLGLSKAILDNVAREGYTSPTPIQTRAIPTVLEGRDVLGLAQTGTGKTAAFSLPVLDAFARAGQRKKTKGPQILILTPTRELALQVAEAFSTYGRGLGVRITSVFGGVGQRPQVDALRRGVDVLVATPGRLIDLMDQGLASLDEVGLLILDEADRMLDMGFIRPIQKIVGRISRERQTLLFSATMPASIRSLANDLLIDPVEVSVAPKVKTAPKVDQELYHVGQKSKIALLQTVLSGADVERAIVFTRTKRGADRLAKKVAPGIEAAVIHGNKSQNARTRALDGFRSGTTKVLIATDVAARGIDVDDISHVVNFDLPNEPESYVHRIGRTGRAGATGIAVSFCDPSERGYLRDIERLTKKSIPVRRDHPYADTEKAPEEKPPVPGRNQPSRGPRSANPQPRRGPSPGRTGRGVPVGRAGRRRTRK